MSFIGSEQIVSVGDVGDTYRADVSEDLTGATKLQIWIDRWIGAAWVNVFKFNGAAVGDPTDGILEAVQSSAFLAAGVYRRYAYVEWGSDAKKGTPTQFQVYP